MRDALYLLILACAGMLVHPAGVAAQPTGEEHVYLTEAEALQEVFPRSTRYVRRVITLTSAQQAAAERALRRPLGDREIPVTLCYDAAGRFVGYAVVSEESGKYRPITYIVGVTPRFAVEKVAIMVYRESRGGEVRTPRFLYQYRGKTTRDPIRTNQDIVNISGATISVRAINAGVKKVLYLVHQAYGSNPPPDTL